MAWRQPPDPETRHALRDRDGMRAVHGMTSELDEEIAHTLDADPRLLPFLPELLADLDELGSSAEQLVAVLRDLGVAPGSSVLDLGCGKGAVAVALAERLDLRVEGVDGFAPFVAAARLLAAERGVGARCVFRQGDVHAELGRSALHDVVLLLSVGPVSGDLGRTVARLRRLVRPGGWIVLDDGFLAREGAAPGPAYARHAGHARTLARLSSSGDRLLLEIVGSAAETRAGNERNTAAIRARAQGLVERHPQAAALIEAYVERQERETELLGADFVCALWVLERAADAERPARVAEQGARQGPQAPGLLQDRFEGGSERPHRSPDAGDPEPVSGFHRLPGLPSVPAQGLGPVPGEARDPGLRRRCYPPSGAQRGPSP